MALQEEVCRNQTKSIGVQKTVRRMVINPEIQEDNQQDINKIIDEKLKQLLPNIIE